MCNINISRTCVLTIILLLIFSSTEIYGQELVVNTTLGLVRGVRADDGDYTMYLGIPFGKVREDNPFGEALPHPRYEGIFEANDDSAICPQQEEFNNTIVGTLDCLHLNVHVPNTATPTNLRPVYVWIYGGGFNIGFFGRFLYGPKYLIKHDIVLVTFNYRLGPYGFMCLDIPEVPGNQGLKDQIMALKWIRENIANFGGDPDKVTIGGNSAGGMSAESHMLRKDNDGEKLFHKVIIQSGSMYIPGGSSGPPRDVPIQLARHLEFVTDDIYEAISFLSRVDPKELIQSNLELGLIHSTCVEKEFPGVEGFLTEDLRTKILPRGKDVDVMIGFNDDEFKALVLNGLTESNGDVTRNIITNLFGPNHPDFDFLINNMYQFYFGDEIMSDELIQNYADLTGDNSFVYPTHRSIKRFLENDASTVYLYVFSYVGGRNFVKHRNGINVGGALHADEYGYLFDISYMDEPNADDQAVIDAMTSMWANFVKYSDPTPETCDLPVKWQSITKNSPYHYIDINRELQIGTRPLRERMTYWDSLMELYEN